jgi:TonB family protein
MNGQFVPPEPSSPSPSASSTACDYPRLNQPAPWWADPEAEALHLLAALALSCLLHAALVFLPFFGRSAVETRLALKSSQKMPPVVTVTLRLAGENRFDVKSVPPAAVIEPAAAAVERPAVEGQLQAQTGAEGADLLPLPALGYYTTDQLTKRPQPVSAIELDSTETSPIVVSGKIVLRIWINEFGSVADVELEASDLPEVFSRTAIAAFKSLRFAPGELNGLPVGTVMRIEVNYDDGRLPEP